MLSRHVIGQMLPDVVFGCLRQAIPDRVPAEGTSCLWNLNVRGPSPGSDSKYGFSMVVTSNGGTGARPDKDGLSATAYLVIRYATPDVAGIGVATMTGPTVIGMVGCTLAAVTAALVPWRLAWVPLLAPLLVVGIVVVAWVISAPDAAAPDADRNRSR